MGFLVGTLYGKRKVRLKCLVFETVYLKIPCVWYVLFFLIYDESISLENAKKAIVSNISFEIWNVLFDLFYKFMQFQDLCVNDSKSY